MAGRGSKPGERRGGRQKGTPNRVTKCVKDAIVEALNAGDGATAFFEKLKADDPKTFAQVAARLIPTEMTGADGKDLFPEKPVDTYEGRMEVARRVAFLFSEADYALKNGQFSDGVKPST